MKVWCKVNNLSPSKVEAQEGGDLDDLKQKIVKEYRSELTTEVAARLAVFTSEGDSMEQELSPDAPIPVETTCQMPLIIRVLESQRPEANKRPKLSLSRSLLVNPLEVVPPPAPTTPPFVCSDNWLNEIECEISRQLAEADFTEKKAQRVPPMALVRCSRGGKTRALYEIANLKLEHNGNPVSIIYVSFNDFSPLEVWEQKDPLRALCTRIAFAALKTRHYDGSLPAQFTSFQNKHYSITNEDILSWLGDVPALLLVDELNNLSELAVKNSYGAREFARFIKDTFLAQEGRYFVFTSHVLTTLGFLGVFLDPSNASDRHVVMHELPLVDNLSTASSYLYSSLDAREAIYYGLMPGMIFEWGQKHSVAGKRNNAIKKYNEELATISGEQREIEFNSILLSLLTGEVEQVPEALHTLLDTSAAEPGSEKIRWVPYHLEFVMQKIRFIDLEKSRLAQSIANLCKQLHDAKESSGDGWEALFVLFLLARCINAQWHDALLPKFAFRGDQKAEVRYNEPYDNSSLRCFSQCHNWKELKDGIKPSKKPQISVYFPTHAKFEAYDVVVMFSEQNRIERVYGYQLKEGSGNSKQPVESDFFRSFVVKGDPPDGTLQKAGWCIPSGMDIDDFFGESGKYWTPKEWKKLSATVGTQITCS